MCGEAMHVVKLLLDKFVALTNMNVRGVKVVVKKRVYDKQQLYTMHYLVLLVEACKGHNCGKYKVQGIVSEMCDVLGLKVVSCGDREECLLVWRGVG
ncbi:hypothetical protein Pyrfu_0998 [Pyrolobus fumarii 1A]|uniref:Uncharacterized protein n=1 Tax=Pyrolobus fumarii (strain DSM 11204 / 1A) TaxID=694429 RepID=G0EEP4_PYRF1|nr:hypothetical protein Pyrfu_0998 [Pyrolobus fumarii 1A]